MGKTTHGGYGTRLHNIWHGMLQRCEYEGHTKYENYGGRGIIVCADWHDFAKFRAWAKENGYRAPLTLDRVDPDGNYEPGNCRWVTYKVQNLNRRMWLDRVPPGQPKANPRKKYSGEPGADVPF